MYKEHPSLIEPKEEAVLWRYLDIAKFLHLLDSSSLFFTRLTNFSDPYEGHMTKKTLDELMKIPKDFPEEERLNREKTIRQDVEFFIKHRPILCASCWHENETESSAMWSQYTGTGEGLAIRTSFKRFKEAFKPAKLEVSAGMIQYIDYNTHNLDPRNIFNFGILKRQSFAHERELRALIMEPSNSPGVYVDIDLATLIESVVVSPGSPSWFYDVVVHRMETLGFGEKVVKSSLMDHPDYLVDFFQSGYGS